MRPGRAMVAAAAGTSAAEARSEIEPGSRIGKLASAAVRSSRGPKPDRTKSS